jgi:hypothetical protein
MQFTVGILAVLAFSNSALAAPTYLECTLSDSDNVWNVTLDEATSSFSYTIPKLEVVQKGPAVFTAEKVMFKSMEISRVTLVFTRRVVIAGVMDETTTGQCKIAENVKRAF